jgi:hypothetical protein
MVEQRRIAGWFASIVVKNVANPADRALTEAESRCAVRPTSVKDVLAARDELYQAGLLVRRREEGGEWIYRPVEYSNGASGWQKYQAPEQGQAAPTRRMKHRTGKAPLRPAAGPTLKPSGELVRTLTSDIVYLENPEYTLRQLASERAACLRWILAHLPDLLDGGTHSDEDAMCTGCLRPLPLREDVGAFSVIQFGTDAQAPLIAVYCWPCTRTEGTVERLAYERFLEVNQEMRDRRRLDA